MLSAGQVGLRASWTAAVPMIIHTPSSTRRSWCSIRRVPHPRAAHTHPSPPPQVRFGVLNAGNFGVAQSRKRTFIWAAAPGEGLPDWPRLMHAFRTPQLTINLPNGVQYTAVPQTVRGNGVKAGGWPAAGGRACGMKRRHACAFWLLGK